MENFIVRIYRRDEGDPQGLTGLVEIAGEDEKKRFNSFDELSKILNPVKKYSRKPSPHKKMLMSKAKADRGQEI